ncbi:MAG: hypothetical protein WC120_00090 [Parcubacteria group bacterium]
MENKKSKKITGLFLAIFILSAGFLFFNLGINHSYAYSVDCANIDATALGVCTGGNSMMDANSNIKQDITCADCSTGPNSYCGKDSWNYCKWIPNEATNNNTPVNSPDSKAVIAANNPADDICPGITSLPGMTWIACVFLIILKFAGWILSVAVSLFAWVVDAEKLRAVLVHPAIFESWKVVRDFLNIGFILVLLFSAFSTIFQVDKYNYKKILLWLVIMALLVNFSYPITRFIIDASNVLMYTILNNSFGAYTSDPQQILTKAMGGFDELQTIITASGAKTSLTQLLASIVFVFILALTILSMATLFVIRTIALAILIIFSPIAFIGSIIGKGGQWWDYLFKYALFGPIMVFMLAISISIMKAMGSVPINGGSEPIITSMSRFIIPIVVLWIGMGVAQKMGIEGASMALANAQGMSKWVGGLLKKSSMAGIKAIDRNTLAKLHVSPRQFLKAWHLSTEEAESDKLSAGTGVWHDRINKVFSFGKHKTNYADLERQKLVSKKTKELKEISEEAPYLLDKLSGSMGSSSPEAVAEMKAIFRIIYGNNDQDELMGYIQDNIAAGTDVGKKFKNMFKEGETTISGENVSNAVIKLMENSNVNPDEINKELLDLGNVAASKGGIGYGAVEYNQEKKRFDRVTGIEAKKGKQAWSVASKIMTTGEAQNIPKTLHRNHFTDQGTEANLNDAGKALLRKYASPTAIKHIERHKPDFYKSLCLEADPKGTTVADKMLLYASELQKGTADGWDPSEKEHSEKLKDTEQALSAAAWTVALQTKAGVPKATIQKKLKGLFSDADIKKIINLSTNKDINADSTS